MTYKYTVAKPIEVEKLEASLNALIDEGAELVQILDSGMNYWRIVSRKETAHGREEDGGAMETPKRRDRKSKEQK